MEKTHSIPANSCIIHLLHAVIELNYNESAVYLLYKTHLGEHFYVQTKDIQEFWGLTEKYLTPYSNFIE